MIQIVKGVQNTVEAIKAIDERSIIVQVEATGLNRAIRQDLQVLATEDQRRGYLFYDLISGMVDPEHPLFGWLLRNGASVADLAEIAARRTKIDVMGMNFYPQWSTQEVYLDSKGRVSYRHVEPEGQGFASLIEDYYRRYEAPIVITETSTYGPIEVSSRWMAESIAAVKKLRAKGIPVLGYTWFPLFTMIDWRYRLGRTIQPFKWMLHRLSGAKLMEAYGERVQRSIFECRLDPNRLTILVYQLKALIKPRQDRIRIYHLCERCPDLGNTANDSIHSMEEYAPGYFIF